jgi:hypothetical protein
MGKKTIDDEIDELTAKIERYGYQEPFRHPFHFGLTPTPKGTISMGRVFNERFLGWEPDENGKCRLTHVSRDWLVINEHECRPVPKSYTFCELKKCSLVIKMEVRKYMPEFERAFHEHVERVLVGILKRAWPIDGE